MQIYNSLVGKKASLANVEQFWNFYFQSDIIWNQVWINQTRKLTSHMYLAEFNFKILHRISPCGAFLHRWQMLPSGYCNICNLYEDYEHMFVSCKFVENLWDKIALLIKKAFDIELNITFKVIILGYRTSITEDFNQITHVINIVLSLAKYVIFRIWCRYKSEKDTYMKIKKSMYRIFKSNMKYYTLIEKTNQSKLSNILDQVCLRL